MFRLIYVLFLICLSTIVIGQNVEIGKSRDMIVIRGKSYYLHTVLPGQTLYSICKAYGLSVEEVKEMNDRTDNSLDPYDVLKLSYVEEFIMQDDKYYYHKAIKGETLYSIARDYDIKPKRLLKYNKEYDDNPLSLGSVVRLPLDEIDLSVLDPKETQVTNVVVPVAQAIPVVDEPNESDNRKESEKKGVIDSADDSSKETSSIQNDGVVMPSTSFVKIALLLPLSAREYPMFVDELEVETMLTEPLFVEPSFGDSSLINSLQAEALKVNMTKISSRSEIFIRFYEGILFAVDSLKKRGYKIELHVYDTERNREKMYFLVDEINRLNPDLIIGPVYGAVYKALIDTLQNKNIPMIYPFSRSENIGKYSNFIQVNSSFEVVADKMLKWIGNQPDSANIINLNILNGDYADKDEKQMFRDSLKRMKGVVSFDWDLENIPLDNLRTLFSPDKENLLVLPFGKEADAIKVLSRISALADVYPITVLGLPEWQTFELIEHDTYYKLNVKIFTHSYVDYSKDATKAIVNKFRKYYHIEPNVLTLKAFDMGLYFIELAAKYRNQSLAALEYHDRSTTFCSFRFRKIKNGLGKENNGFYIVNYSKDFLLKIEEVEK